MPAKKKQSFEEQLSELEAIATRMEEGDLSLETALAEFEKGLKAARHCQEALSSAEQKIEKLIAEGDEIFAMPFDDEEDEDFELDLDEEEAYEDLEDLDD